MKAKYEITMDGASADYVHSRIRDYIVKDNSPTKRDADEQYIRDLYHIVEGVDHEDSEG